MSLLKKLYSGEIYPAEKIVPRNPEYRRIEHRISDDMHDLEKNLSKEDFEKVERIKELCYETSSMTIEETFVYGVKFGISLMAEVIIGEEWDK